MKEHHWIWIAVIAAVIAIIGVASCTPRCKPGDQAIYIGGMLMAGCPKQ